MSTIGFKTGVLDQNGSSRSPQLTMLNQKRKQKLNQLMKRRLSRRISSLSLTQLQGLRICASKTLKLALLCILWIHSWIKWSPCIHQMAVQSLLGVWDRCLSMIRCYQIQVRICLFNIYLLFAGKTLQPIFILFNRCTYISKWASGIWGAHTI